MVNYQNQEIKPLLEKYITQEKYGPYKPILEEIVQRRKFEYNISQENIEKQLLELVSSLEKIEVSDKYFGVEDNTGGIYDQSQKKIVLNKNILDSIEKNYRLVHKDASEQEIKSYVGNFIFAILTHETYHAMSEKEDGLIGVIHKNQWGFDVGRAHNEVITESAANRTCYNNTVKDIEVGYHKTIGYGDTTFYTNMLAYALGVSEKELLQHGLVNNEDFFNYIASKFPETSRSDVETKYNILEAHLSRLQELDQINDIEMKRRILVESSGIIYNNLFELASSQIACSQEALSPEFVGSAFYRFHKMKQIMANSIGEFDKNGILTFENLKEIINMSERSRKTMRNQSLDLFFFMENDGDPEIDKSAYTCAKSGILNSYFEYEEPESKEEYTRKSMEEKEQELLGQTDLRYQAFLRKIKEDDFSHQNIWNDEIPVVAYDVYTQEKKKKQENVIEPFVENINMFAKEEADDEGR